MKTFIFVLYILFVLIIPQIYTLLVRINDDDYDSQAVVVILGGAITALLITGFTIALINWNIISITL